MDKLVREVTEIWLHPNDFNTDNEFMLSQAWYSLINLLLNADKVKQHLDGTELERSEVGLRNVNTEQELDSDHPCVGLG